MMFSQAAAGLGTDSMFKAGQTLTSGDVTVIDTIDFNAQKCATMYASCKSQRVVLVAGAALVGALVGYLMGHK
jgi:hypothetical protein